MLLSQIVGIALLFPFFGWAIFLLRRRFQFHEENTLLLEVLTALALGGFIWIESSILSRALEGQMLLYLFAILGLSVSAFALYAHVVISLASRILVDMVTPAHVSAAHQPRFGPVDALERNEDYEGALQEYLVLARIYPRNYEVLFRTARVQEILDSPGEAAAWYLRARKRASRADEALAAVNHLCVLYDNHLDQPDQAELQLAQFIQDYPDSPDRPIVVDRLERRADRAHFSVSSFLESLEEHGIEEPAVLELASAHVASAVRQPVELVDLATAGAADQPRTSAPEPEVSRAPKSIFLDNLEESSLAPAADEVTLEKPRTKAKRSGIEALDTAAPLESPLPAGQNVERKPKISLDPMDS